MAAEVLAAGRPGPHDPLRRPRRRRRRRVVCRAAAGGAARGRDLHRQDRHRLVGRHALDVRTQRERLLLPQHDDRAGRAERRQRPHGRPRVRPSPRSLDAGRRRRRAERHARVVAGARHRRARAPAHGRDQLRPRLGPQHRRDLRRGLRAARAGRIALQHPVARRPGRDGAGGDPGGSRARPAPGGGPPAGDQAREAQPQRQPRATAQVGDPVQPARPEPPCHRDRDASPAPPRSALARRSKCAAPASASR